MTTSDVGTAEYTGKDVSYYLVRIESPKRLDPYDAECEDIIEALGMTFAEGCAFKAIWRKCAARTLGIAKAGYKGGLYDAEKAEYYGARMVAAELRAATVKESLTVRPAHIDPADVDIASLDDGIFRRQATEQHRPSQIFTGVSCMVCGHKPGHGGLQCPTLTPMANVEPASAIDDDSERMQAIGQNGNCGEHYRAPDWSKAPDNAVLYIDWTESAAGFASSFYCDGGDRFYRLHCGVRASTYVLKRDDGLPDTNYQYFMRPAN